MNELIESALWTGGLLTTISGLVYILTVIDPRTDRGDGARSVTAMPVSEDVAPTAMSGRAAG